MVIQFWQQPNFQAPYGTLSILRTDPGGLVVYAWRVADSRAAEAQDWIGPQMLLTPEPPPPSVPAPPPDPILAEIDALNLAASVKDVLRKMAQR